MLLADGWTTLPHPIPDRPWRVSLVTTACDRLGMLEATVRHALAGGSPSALAAGRLERARGGSHAQIAARILRRAQALGYRPDRAGEEWFQPVQYTMLHGGDCEDLAAAFVAMARAAGLQAELAWIDQRPPLNHVTSLACTAMTCVGDPRRDDGWVWADPSVAGALLGEDPELAARRLGQLQRLGLTA